LVLDLLDRLSEQTQTDFDVIVVDDSSGDGTYEQLQERAVHLPYPVRILTTPSNAGPATARNVGWRASQAEYVCFIDDDVTPEPGYLEAGVRALDANPRVGVLQGRTLLSPDTDLSLVHWGPPNWNHVHIIEGPTPYFEGCNIFYRREAFEVTGGFDEEIGWWGEDTSAGWRVIDAGWERGFAADAVATHPLSHRGALWFMRNGWSEQNMVCLGKHHPAYRSEAFWRPWAYRREDAAFALALVSAVAAFWFWPTLVLTLPYLWWRRPPVKQLAFFRLCLQIPAVDAARLVGHLRGSLAARTFVL
jgi:glycosyltransferase involved in cell wall biosynthesis